MQLLYASTLNEAEKLLWQKKTKVVLLLSMLVPVISAMLLSRFQSNTGIAFGAGTAFPLLMLNLFTTVLLPLFLFMTVADMFAGEAASRALKNVLVRPISRVKIFTSKLLAMALFLFVQLAIIWVSSTLAGLFLDSSAVFSGFLESAGAYLAASLPLMAMGLFAVLLSLCWHSSVGAYASCMVVYLAAKLLPYLFPQAATWSFFSYTDWHMMWIGNAASFQTLFPVFVFLLSNCIMGYTAGWYLFERKQF
ncbi:ABC transporter permease [Brevibacillus ruminantium]|uniref:ABC transporter permease n=1 Tax=Brevibacillus ruminantium TaxID=2950604 RepID=A0ABY4WCY5_9BACL|nr:ABC transporter permease [Brevibacillus ruminantium]USG65025.1 ABC transporter permease [Brevibacillus ruminantium]